jgi:sulfonate transport system permease protein
MNQPQKHPPVKTQLRPSILAKQALPWIVPVALLIAWQWASSAGILPSRFLPSPRAVVSSFIELSASGELWMHVRVSTLRALSGFVVGGGVGLLLGLLTASLRWAEVLLDTTIQMVRNIPPLALIPLVILWFGIDESAKLFLVALGVFFPSTSTPFTAFARSIADFWRWGELMACLAGRSTARLFFPERCPPFW